MGHPVSLSTPTGRITGWRTDPPIQPRGALVVLHETSGLNAHIRHMVDRFAAHGFIALAPALFDHIDYHIELGYSAEDLARGNALITQIDVEHALGDLQAAVDELRGDVPVGAVGFGWGGTLAYLANTRLGLPAVAFYAEHTLPFLRERLRAPMEFHFGERDPLIPPAQVQAHRDAHAEAKIYVYPADHGFACDQRPQYDPHAALEAIDHTVGFFTRVLR